MNEYAGFLLALIGLAMVVSTALEWRETKQGRKMMFNKPNKPVPAPATGKPNKKGGK